MRFEGKDLRTANHNEVAGPRRELAIERLSGVPTERHFSESQGYDGRYEQEQNVAGRDASNEAEQAALILSRAGAYPTVR
jgi:hypothetical protein